MLSTDSTDARLTFWVSPNYKHSPINGFCFGIADETMVDELLNAFVYFEHEGGKGPSYVVSMIHKFLNEMNLLDKDDPIGEITFSFDNCAGQNKNRVVLGYFAWLVEEGYFLKANVLFLVRGHTKNACDRTFNLLKTQYRNQDIFTRAQFLEALRSAKNVHVDWMPPAEMLNWESSIDPIFAMPPSQTFKNHNFTFTHDKPGKILISAYDGQPVQEFSCHARGKKALPESIERSAHLASAFLPKPLDALQMSNQKRNEMYNKWRKFIPTEHQVDWWFTTPPSPEAVAEVRTEKRAAVARRKKAKTAR